MAYVDSQPGYLDVTIDHGIQRLASNPGHLDITIEAPQRVPLWTIIDGQRRPLFPRDRLTARDRRDRLIPGQFFPDATTTGVYDENALEHHDGDLIINTPGYVLENKWIHGRLEVRAPGVRVRNCRVTGPTTGPATGLGLVTATNAAVTDFLLEDSDVYPQHPNDLINCFNGHHMTLRRVNAHHGVDILGVIGQLGDDRADVTVEGSWFHDMVMYNTTSQEDNLTHNDLIQWHGLKGVTIVGSRLEAFVDPAIGCASEPPVFHPTETYPNGKPVLISGNPNYPGLWGFSALMGSPARKLMGDLVVRKSWIDGGAVGFNLSGPDLALFPDVGTFEDNWFGSDYRIGPDFAILAKAAQTITIGGNHRWNKTNPWDTSTDFNVRKNG